MPHRPHDISWHEEFLAQVRDGKSFSEAIKDVGSTKQTLYQHFQAFPDFRQQALTLRRTSGRSRSGPLPYVHGREKQLVGLAIAGLTVEQTAYVLGVAYHTVYNWLRRHPKAQATIRERRAEQGLPSTRSLDWPVDIDDLLELLRLIASGLDLRAACGQARIPEPTLKRWRRGWPQVDALVVAAAADGRQRAIRPYRRLECPGRYCGTSTGYDYGCRRTACRTAAVTRVTQQRESERKTRERPE
ncbi:hypothetical protein [Thermoactinospora rubra]|uniref:hypothetical protein n=1 Tax=Thermoactinospora rubra TaxID=1088767 RepID=UPI000A11FD8B|nr:hypothetical protein [Thermoactinospora rubra]